MGSDNESGQTDRSNYDLCFISPYLFIPKNKLQFLATGDYFFS